MPSAPSISIDAYHLCSLLLSLLLAFTQKPYSAQMGAYLSLCFGFFSVYPEIFIPSCSICSIFALFLQQYPKLLIFSLFLLQHSAHLVQVVPCRLRNCLKLEFCTRLTKFDWYLSVFAQFVRFHNYGNAVSPNLFEIQWGFPQLTLWYPSISSTSRNLNHLLWWFVRLLSMADTLILQFSFFG